MIIYSMPWGVMVRSVSVGYVVNSPSTNRIRRIIKEII